MTEEQASDPDQSENSMGEGAGCLPIRRRKRREPIWRRPQEPGRTAHVRQRSRLGARAEPPPGLPGASGGLRGRGKQRAEPVSRRWGGWRPWGGRTTVGSSLGFGVRQVRAGLHRPRRPPEEGPVRARVRGPEELLRRRGRWARPVWLSLSDVWWVPPHNGDLDCGSLRSSF